MPDSDLEQKIAQYAAVAAEDKNIDAASLMISALQEQPRNQVSSSSKRWAYLVSIGLPPLGLLFAVWFYFGDKDDGKKTAWVCIALTAISLIIFLITLRAFVSTSGVGLEQVQSIQPSDIRELTQ